MVSKLVLKGGYVGIQELVRITASVATKIRAEGLTDCCVRFWWIASGRAYEL